MAEYRGMSLWRTTPLRWDNNEHAMDTHANTARSQADDLFRWRVSLMIINPDSDFYGGYFNVKHSEERAERGRDQDRDVEVEMLTQPPRARSAFRPTIPTSPPSSALRPPSSTRTCTPTAASASPSSTARATTSCPASKPASAGHHSRASSRLCSRSFYS